MAKWVIKNGDHKKEVWRYIDTVEEANKYWYIQDTIEKYGVNEVLPIAMNAKGGYHTLRNDDIIKIIESDEMPVLSLDEMWEVNAKNFKCGWVSPECVTYSCDTMDHLDLASHICSEVYNKEETIRPDDFLLDNGWIKVYYDGWTGVFDKINNAQVDMMENRGFKHHTFNDMDYEYIRELMK